MNVIKTFRPMPAVAWTVLRGGARFMPSGGWRTRLADAGARTAAGSARTLFPSRSDSGWSHGPAAVSPDGGRPATHARTALWAAIALALASCSPAAADTPVWQDAGAQIPASATLDAVATGGGAVVAVGDEDGAAVAYSHIGDAWLRTVLPATGTTSSAVDVALDANGDGWAVGWQAGDDGTRRALIDRYSGGVWTAVDAGSAPALGAVAASADVAYAGDVTGGIHPLSATGLGPAYAALPPGAVIAVNSLALTSGGDAIGGGLPGSGSGASSSLVQVDGTNARVTQSAAVPAQGPGQIVAVAAAGAAQLAVDGSEPCTAPAGASEPVPSAWTPDAASGAWQRDTTFPATGATRLCDATFAPDGDGVVVGSIAGRLAVWRHAAADGAWSRVDDLGPGELRGVAMTGDEGWAVGAGGTLLHFAVPPPPPPVEPAPDPVPADPPATDTGQQPPASDPPPAQPDSAPASDPPPATPAAAPASAPAEPVVDVTSEQRDPTSGSSAKRRSPAAGGRLLARLAVHRAGRNRLDVRFELRTRARVTVTALLGRRIVGRHSQALPAGRRHLSLTYRGSHPPTRLDIVVHRLGAGAHAQGGQQ